MATAEDLGGFAPGPAQVGRRIRELRRGHNRTQVELAREIGVQQSDLSRIENGEYRVSLDVLFRLLRVFELSIGEFFAQLTEDGLPTEDLELVRSVRSLSEEGQREVVDFVEFRLRKERLRRPRGGLPDPEKP